MKLHRMLAIAGLSALLASPAFAQSPQIPMGAGVNVDRPPVGSRSPGAMRRSMPPSCAQQAAAKGLRGEASRAFRDKCRRNGGR